jgi:drug/metabolite transporter (DMT)-like permease
MRNIALNRKLAIGLLVFANVMWGSSYAVVKVALEELPPPLLGVIYLAIVASVVCHLVWFHVVRVAGANLGAISLFVQPLVGSLLGLFVLHEPLTITLVAGAALIFAALYFTTVPGRNAAAIEIAIPEA